MAEPIGITSGLLTLSTFAFTSSISLYQAIKSFQNNHRAIRELKEELEALDGVLQSLRLTIASDDADLSSLKLPLFQCGKVCREFEAMITKHTARSAGGKSSLRDWAKLKYMGDDILSFKNMLAGYKSTISIALADVNLRTTAVTVKVLAEYKDMISNTTSDLQYHLYEIDQKLENLSPQDPILAQTEDDERSRIEEEKESTEQCLRICAWVSEHIYQVETNTFENISTTSDKHQALVSSLENFIPARRVTTNVFKDCKERLLKTTIDLEKHLDEINRKLQNPSSRGALTLSDHARDRVRIQEEREGIQQCLAVCAEASEQADSVRTNVFEDVSAAQDADQIAVATLGDLISARRVTAEARSTQWLGQMSDTSLQQLSRDRRSIASKNASEAPSMTDRDFEGRYGTGKRLDSSHLLGRRSSMPVEQIR